MAGYYKKCKMLIKVQKGLKGFAHPRRPAALYEFLISPRDYCFCLCQLTILMHDWGLFFCIFMRHVNDVWGSKIFYDHKCIYSAENLEQPLLNSFILKGFLLISVFGKEFNYNSILLSKIKFGQKDILNLEAYET